MVPHESSLIAVAQRAMAPSARGTPHRPVVWLRGEHDASTAAALSATMAEAIALDNANVVVDLSEVDYMGVATVVVFIDAVELLRLRSRSLILRAPSMVTRRVLEVCDLAHLIEPAVRPVGR